MNRHLYNMFGAKAEEPNSLFGGKVLAEKIVRAKKKFHQRKQQPEGEGESEGAGDKGQDALTMFGKPQEASDPGMEGSSSQPVRGVAAKPTWPGEEHKSDVKASQSGNDPHLGVFGVCASPRDRGFNRVNWERWKKTRRRYWKADRIAGGGACLTR